MNGFRPGRSPHQALDALTVGIQRKRVNMRRACVQFLRSIERCGSRISPRTVLNVSTQPTLLELWARQRGESPALNEQQVLDLPVVNESVLRLVRGNDAAGEAGRVDE